MRVSRLLLCNSMGALAIELGTGRCVDDRNVGNIVFHSNSDFAIHSGKILRHRSLKQAVTGEDPRKASTETLYSVG